MESRRRSSSNLKVKMYCPLLRDAGLHEVYYDANDTDERVVGGIVGLVEVHEAGRWRHCSPQGT